MASNSRRKGPSGGASSSSAAVSTSLNSRSQSLPQLQAASWSQPESFAASSSSTEYASGVVTAVKCRGDFCRVVPSSLRGLYGARLGHENNEDPSDDGDGNADATPRQRGLSADHDVVLQDDGRRFKIGNNNLLLAKAEHAFVMGTVNTKGKDSDDVALQWQEADNVHRMELGRANPSAFYKQVGVCRNCHRIYADLANFRELGFQWDVKQKPAWAAAEESQKKGRGGAGDAVVKKKKKQAGGVGRQERSPVDADNDFATPEDDATLHYDRLFLEELAKHSNEDIPSMVRDQSDSSARSEKEAGSATRSSIRRTSVDSLPTLSVANISSKPKKPASSVVESAKREDPSSNQQLGVPHSGRHQGTVVDGTVTARLEAMIHQLREQVATEQATVKRAEAQRLVLEQKLSQNQVYIQEKEDEFRKKLLEAELESMSKTMHQGNSQQSTTSSSSSAKDVGELIETIDSLNLQLHEANRAAEKVRRDLQQAHQQELKRLHEKYQLEMESLRLSEYTAKEQTEAAHMQMSHWQNEAQVASSQAKSAKAALDDLNKTRLPQLEERNQRLERQMAEIKAKLATASALSPPAGSAEDLAAIEKHLNNKIDYLKAQLASEMKCKEELGSHLAGITTSMEALKKEKRTALADQDETHKRHLERVEANFAQEKDVLNAQLASFQAKITTLHANVTDLVQELALGKSREANTKLAMEKMAEENVRLTRQIVDLEGHIETLQDERKRDGAMGVKNANDETQRMQTEALLRRLDNERQYLKNQVDNEAELKIQLQRKVIGLEEELRELKSTTEEMTKIAEHKISTLNAEISQLQRQLRDEKVAMEESKLMLTRQLKDMQVKFLQTREQSLLDKDELEKARVEVNQARSLLVSAHEETLKEKEYGKSANERMSKALATIKSSLKAMEEEKNLRIHRLEEENNAYMQKLAKAQGELLVLENKWSEDKHTARRQQAVARFVSAVVMNIRSRHAAAKASAFWQLHCLAVQTKLKNDVVAAHEQAMRERETELRQNFMDKSDQLTQALHAERVEALEQANAIRVKEQEALQQYYLQERSQLEEDLQHIHTRQMRELEDQYEQTLKSVDEQSASALAALQSRCDELEQERNEARAGLIEMRTRWEQMGSTVEEKQQLAVAELLERERAWNQERTALLDSHAQQISELEKTSERRLCEQREDHQNAVAQSLSEIDDRHEQELRQLRADLERDAANMVTSINKERAQELEILKEHHSKELEHEKQQLVESLRKEMEQERAKHEKALKNALERVEQKTQGHLESLQKDMNDRKANALLQCTAKWQKAMEDLQARFEIEKRVAYENGLQDRENEWQQAALQIKQKQKEELDSVQNEAVRAIQAAEERHRMLLQSQTTLLRKELEEKQRGELEIMRQHICATEETNCHRKIELALKEQETLLLSRFNEDMQNIREELADDHNADMKSLEEKWTLEKEKMVKLHEQEQRDLTKHLEEVWTRNAEEVRAEKESEFSSRLAELRQSHTKDVEELRHGMQEVFALELASKLKEQEERLLNDQEEAINQVQEDSERLIEQVEVAMGELKKQKEVLENELTRLRSALEEAEDAHFDTEENLKKQQKIMVFQLMVTIMRASKTLDDANHTHTQQMMELQSKHDHLDAVLQREKRQWESDIARIRDTWSQVQSRHAEMLQTLINYKRDELVAHRSASAVLSNEVSIVMKQMEEVTEMKVTLEKEIEQLQGEAHGVEASLRQLMVQNSSSGSSLSGAGDSSLNMAVVAKKRRLNEEFEALLEQVERKKAEVRNIDKTLGSLRQRREEKENELKAMERKLVEILVGQQKQMLTLLNATREVALPVAVATVAAS